MALVRFDPFRELEDLSTRVGALLARRSGPQADLDVFGDWAPAVDVQESDAEYLVKADLPEVTRDNVKVGIEDGVLTLEGERRQEKDEKTKHYHRLERAYGKFVRRLTVPTEVDETKVTAEFKDGVLSVHLPKSPTARPRSVAVKVS
jgi:HSP20 family protein